MRWIRAAGRGLLVLTVLLTGYAAIGPRYAQPAERALVEALKKPQVRGSWGEMHLKRAVEQAGLVERCDFDTQVHFADSEGSLRPDMVIHLSGGKHVVVDAKVPMAAFMSAIEG